MSACRYCGNAAPDGADVCLNCRAVLENASDSQQAAINELALLSAGLKESSVSDRTKDERSGSSGTESSGKQSSAPELCAVPGGKSGISARTEQSGDFCAYGISSHNHELLAGLAELSEQTKKEAAEKEHADADAPIVIVSGSGIITNEAKASEKETVSVTEKKVEKVSAPVKNSDPIPSRADSKQSFENITSAYKAVLKTESAVPKTVSGIAEKTLALEKNDIDAPDGFYSRKDGEASETGELEEACEPEETGELRKACEPGETGELREACEPGETGEPGDVDNPAEKTRTANETEMLSAETQPLYSGELSRQDQNITETEMKRDALAAAILEVLNASPKNSSEAQKDRKSIPVKANNTGLQLNGLKKSLTQAADFLLQAAKKFALFLAGKPIGKDKFDQSDLEQNPMLLCIAYFPLLFPVPAILNPRSHYARYISLCGAVLTAADIAVLLLCGLVCNIWSTLFTHTVNIETSFEHVALSYTGFRLISVTETIALILIFIMFIHFAAMPIFGRMNPFAPELLYKLSRPRTHKENVSKAGSVFASRIPSGQSDCSDQKDKDKQTGKATPVKVISSAIAEREAAKAENCAADSPENTMVKITGEPLGIQNTADKNKKSGS